jgi:hypothetical protein
MVASRPQFNVNAGERWLVLTIGYSCGYSPAPTVQANVMTNRREADANISAESGERMGD